MSGLTRARKWKKTCKGFVKGHVSFEQVKMLLSLNLQGSGPFVQVQHLQRVQHHSQVHVKETCPGEWMKKPLCVPQEKEGSEQGQVTSPGLIQLRVWHLMHRHLTVRITWSMKEFHHCFVEHCQINLFTRFLSYCVAAKHVSNSVRIHQILFTRFLSYCVAAKHVSNSVRIHQIQGPVGKLW